MSDGTSQGMGGQSEVAPLSRLLLKHPEDAFVSAREIQTSWNALGYLRPPNLLEAVEEHEMLMGLLEELGAGVELLPGCADTTMDSIYVRDASVLTDQGMILCNMGKKARAPEPEAQAEAFGDLGIPILGKIEGDGRLEGGDVVWLDPKTIVVGRGYRTNDEGIRQLRELLGEAVEDMVVVPLPHWRGPGDVFHLMSILSPIDEDLSLVYSPLLPVPFREFLLDRGISLVEVPEEEFDSMGCNVLAVAPRVCVMLEGNPGTQRRLEDAGAAVHTYKGEEISSPGMGGPTCLTRPILRRV